MNKLLIWSLLVMFSLVIAIKDILTKELLINQVGIFDILLGGGLVSLFLTLFLLVGLKEKIQTFTMWKVQVIRFFTSMLVWFLVTSSFKSMDASSVSVFSKVYIPLFIILGDWLQVNYSSRQKKFAFSAFGLLLVFLVVKILEGEQLLGYTLLLVSVAVVMFEFVLLRNASRSQSLFDVIIIPTLASISVGLLGNWLTGGGIEYVSSNGTTLMYLAFFGLTFNVYYILSTFRYKIFPLGASEYPSLLAVFPIVAFEYFVKAKSPEILSLVLIGSVTILLANAVKVEKA
jgi:hypothetical protein